MGQDLVSREQLVIIGKIGAPFGVNGWLKVNSFTEPESNIWNFAEWFLLEDMDISFNKDIIYLPRIKEAKNKFLVLFNGILDRTNAARLTNKSIAIKRSELPSLQDNQFYWVDLIGAKVYNLSKELCGVLDHIFTTAAHDIMVIKNNFNQQKSYEYLIPYSLGDTVIKVDVKHKIIIVNWIID